VQLPRVEDGGVDDEEEAEGEDGLRHHALHGAHALRQRVHRGGQPAVEPPEQEARHGGA